MKYVKKGITLNEFFNLLVKKYGRDTLEAQEQIAHGENEELVKLVLVYHKTKNYKKPTKRAEKMTMEELRAVIESKPHIATYNKKTRSGAFAEKVD